MIPHQTSAAQPKSLKTWIDAISEALYPKATQQVLNDGSGAVQRATNAENQTSAKDDVLKQIRQAWEAGEKDLVEYVTFAKVLTRFLWIGALASRL